MTAVIAPGNYRDGMTFAEAVDGYIADGESPQHAEALAHVLLNPPPPGLPVV